MSEPPASPRPEPTLLPNGDVLVPVFDHETETTTMVRLPVGHEHHAGWIEYMQRDQSKTPGGSEEGRRWKRTPISRLVTGLLIFLGIWWWTGAMDPMLASIGLNKNPCIRSLAGGTLCGNDARRLCREPIFRDAQACRDISDEP